MNYHKQEEFTTRDRDHDAHFEHNCALRHYGGWWYNKCYEINLNGEYGKQTSEGICLKKRDGGQPQCNINFTQMKLKPRPHL